MNSGLYKYFEYEANGQVPSEHMFDSILASSAMPGIFPPIVRDGQVLLDGGIVWKNDAVNAIQYCRD
jgi:predicted patatin/cPLA2 family phospholipase